ncbi:transcriptional regulator [Lactiplantibacillus garii]|uniref:Transcriptional regulator n=1 Tax=Lactiplantibacillus garii TaxID=2306423 RepID=A0A3R8J5E4_9LACO|nr:transcriptional regulator [Lactiplantibacillus garii]RRK09603.1 transcriptional regulator [Lactiplantibacillus garii]
MDEPWLTEDVQKVLRKAHHQAETADALTYVFKLMRQANIKPTELQLVILINHVSEMVDRSITGEQLPAVDPEMFAGVSPVALKIGSQLVDHIGNLAASEKYVVSIHFETALQN